MNELHETKLNAIELTLIALLATHPDREAATQFMETAALMTDSFFPGSTPEERKLRAARVRERMAYYVRQSA